jgi:DNA-binding transcriptional MerR regulator
VKRRTGPGYRINDVARIAGVSVRALHHYDAIGLLSPSGRTESGYRLYDDEALFRLQQIRIGRELGLSLEEIRRSLDDPAFDRRRALLAQRERLAERADQVARMLHAIDRAIALMNEDEQEEDPMTSDDMKEIFDGFDPPAHEDEARERWGETDAFRESARRTKAYTEADWTRLRDEQAEIYRDAVRAKEAGRRPDEAEPMEVAERHRLSIDRWFYPCGHAHHRRLADMYEADPRFSANIDRFGEGLTPYLSAAIRANAARHGA